MEGKCQGLYKISYNSYICCSAFVNQGIREILERSSEFTNSLKMFRQFAKSINFQTNIGSIKLKPLKFNESFDGKRLIYDRKNLETQQQNLTEKVFNIAKLKPI